MNGDIGIVEEATLAVLQEREVITVNACRRAVRQLDMPVLSFDVYDIHFVPFLVEEGIKTLCRTKRHVVLRRVATTYDGNVTFQLFHCVLLLFMYLRHLSISSAMSSASGLVKSIC